jgi:hypothetical protein
MPSSKPWGFWKNIENQRVFMNSLAKKLNVKQPSDWEKVSRLDILQHGGHFIRQYQGSITKGMKTATIFSYDLKRWS